MARRAPSGGDAIVVGTDFSATAENAVIRAAVLAMEQRAALHVVHVVSRLPRAIARQFFGDDGGSAIDAAWKQLLAKVRAYRIDVRTVTVEGRGPVKALERHARSAHARLIVVGARGRTLPDALIGSTAERVAASSRHPVLLVRTRATRRYVRVTLGADVGTDVAAAVTVAKLAAPEAEIEVVHAFEGLFEATLVLHGASAHDLRTYRAQARAEARDALAPRVAAAGLAASALVLRPGDPRRVLAREDRHAKDALFVIERGQAVLKHVVLGSVSRAVIEHGTSDVLLL